MASNAGLPDVFKPVKPYITLADQLEQKNERAISYYCLCLTVNSRIGIRSLKLNLHKGRVYGVQTAMGINKTAPECKKFLIQNMDLLEKVCVC
jgi:hypothetical protein